MEKKDIICAFSSDSRELYKADIFRTINLPHNHIIHFRYKAKYVDENLINQDKSKWHGKDAIVFFTKGNEINSSTPSITNISIRCATIVDFHYDRNTTDVCHLYMKVGDFCNLSLPVSALGSLPPNKFLSKINLPIPNIISWKECVESVSDSFKGKTFTHIKELRNESSEIIELKYDSIARSSYYELNQGERYNLYLDIGNPDINNCKTELNGSSDDISFHCVLPLEATVQYDLKVIPLSVKKIQTRKAYSTISLIPLSTTTRYREDKVTEHREFATLIEIRTIQRLSTSFAFGFASLFLAIGIGLGRAAIKDDIVWTYALLAAICIFLSTTFLHHYFNKK